MVGKNGCIKEPRKNLRAGDCYDGIQAYVDRMDRGPSLFLIGQTLLES